MCAEIFRWFGWGAKRSVKRVLRLSSISCNFQFWFPLEVVFHQRLSLLQIFSIQVWSPGLSLKVGEDPISGCWDIPLLISLGHLPLEEFFIASYFEFWLSPLNLSFKFEEDLIGCWDITLLIFWGHLPLDVVFIYSNFQCWFGPLIFSFKFEEDLISGCWDIQLLIFCGHLPLEFVWSSLQTSLSFKFEEDLSGCWDDILLIFWGHLPMEVVFIYSNFQFWFGPLIFSFKLEEDLIIACWDIPFLTFRGRLPLEVAFHWRLSSIGGRLPLEVVFNWRLSLFTAISNFGLVPYFLVSNLRKISSAVVEIFHF